MAGKKKNHWYVIVMSNKGPMFVTKVNYSDRTAEWNYKEPPKELDASTAKDLAFGLSANFHTAFAVCTEYEVTYQPYNYECWKIEFVEREEEK